MKVQHSPTSSAFCKYFFGFGGGPIPFAIRAYLKIETLSAEYVYTAVRVKHLQTPRKIITLT